MAPMSSSSLCPARARLRCALFAVSIAGALGCDERVHVALPADAPGVSGAGEVSPTATAESQDGFVDDALKTALESGRPVEALLLLDPAVVATGSADGGLGTATDPAYVATDAGAKPPTAIARVQTEVLAASAESGVTPLFRYETFPMVHVALADEAALQALRRQPAVAHVYADKEVYPTLTQSLPLIKQPEASALGYLGTGTAVAVLDTGTDYTRSAFGSCSAPGTASCKVAYVQDFAPSDGALDDNGHGTNVAGIVLGVAPGTQIIGLDVFSGGTGSSSVILQAVDWVVRNRASYNIVAMNLSLGSGIYTAACPNDVFATGLAAARTAGVMPVVATGNAGSSSGISSPACVPAALSVAAVYDSNVGGLSFPGAACTDYTTSADKVTCFSNSASFMSMFAPGSSISAAGYAMSGTSQATPHVAGAAAVLRGAFPSESMDALFTRLTNAGPTISDARNGVQKKRLDLQAALGTVQPIDRTGPTGSVVINAGAARTNDNVVTLTLSATDASGVSSMCIAEGTTCSTFVAYATSSSFTLTRADGTRTVSAYFKDALGNLSAVTSDTIIFDGTKPIDGTLRATAAVASVGLAMTGASDATSNSLSYKVVASTTGTAPASCATGTELYAGTSATPTVTGLVNGTTYAFRMCAIDGAGNMSAGVTATARPLGEFDAPVGAISINGGASGTTSPDLTLSLPATDATGLSQMCISTTPNCTAFVPYASTATIRSTTTNGRFYVYAAFRDTWGNTTSVPVSASIVVDNVAPTASMFTALLGTGRAAIAWRISDGNGVGSLVFSLRYAPGSTPPSSCTAGTLLYAGANRTFVMDPIAAGKHSFRVCAVDALGNAFAGQTLTITVR
jgi:hypothetical protein